MKNDSQNETEIDAEIMQNRFWAAKGEADVDLEYFLAVFGKNWNYCDFGVLEKKLSEILKIGLGVVPGAKWAEMPGKPGKPGSR